jgi:tetratricopeptide (TPR) repeat protein
LKLRLRELRYQPDEVTFDWVKQFIPEIEKIDQARDRRPAALGTALARTLSIHNAATLLIEDHPADLEMIRYPFWSDLCRTFLPYLDPRPETIEPMEWDLYRNVLPAACQLFDQMLDRLLQLCGDETLICMVSDHGFRLEPNLRGRKGSGSLAFKPCLDPRSFFLMSSSKLAANTQVQSPTTADIAPTLLAAAGIPLAYGSDGRPWVEAFEQSLPFEVRSEGELGLPSRLSGQAESSTAKQDVAENLKYLKAQGYVDPLEVSNRLAAERLEFDQGLIRFSLLVYRERTEEAAALAHLLCQRRPCAIGLRLQFIQDLFYLGCIEDAGTLAEEAYDLLSALSHEKQKRAEPSIAAEARLALLSGLIAWKNGRMEEAVRYLDEAGEHPAPTALTHLLRGEAYLKIGEVARALKAFELAEKIEPLAQEASLGRARCLIKFRRFDEALDPLLSVVEVRPNSPLPQFLMGLVLDEMGQTQTAVVTLQRCLQLSPSFDSARQLLDRIEAR